jgi:hypothetical protein
VHDIEDGRREQSWDTFQVLFDHCAGESHLPQGGR